MSETGLPSASKAGIKFAILSHPSVSIYKHGPSDLVTVTCTGSKYNLLSDPFVFNL